VSQLTGIAFSGLYVQTMIYKHVTFGREFFFYMAHYPLAGQSLLFIETSRSHSDTSHSVGLLCTSDQTDAENSTWQHTTLARDIHPCPWRDPSPQSQQASGRRPTA
jgi:hypothetical protein